MSLENFATIIGAVVVILLLSLLVTTIVQLVVWSVNLRGVHLASARRDLSAALTHDRSTLARWQAAIATDLDRLLVRLSRDLYGRSGKAPGGGHSVLNLWMRHVAPADLHDKARVIAGTLASAPAASAEPLSLIAPPGSAAAIADQATEHRRECDRLREEVASATGRARRGITLASPQVRVDELGPLERAIDARVFGDLRQAPFAKSCGTANPKDPLAVVLALEEEHDVPRPEVGIGRPEAEKIGKAAGDGGD